MTDVVVHRLEVTIREATCQRHDVDAPANEWRIRVFRRDAPMMLSDLLPAQMVRSLGLGMLRSVSPLRAFFMREGLHPGSGTGVFG